MEREGVKGVKNKGKKDGRAKKEKLTSRALGGKAWVVKQQRDYVDKRYMRQDAQKVPEFFRDIQK